MKKITKIAASLMALAVTASSMSSIPASAASTSKKFYFYDSSYPGGGMSIGATAAVNFLPSTQYSASTTHYYKNTYYRWVSAKAWCNNFQPQVTRWTYRNETVYATINRSAKDVNSFQSAHMVLAYKWDGTGELVANTYINL